MQPNDDDDAIRGSRRSWPAAARRTSTGSLLDPGGWDAARRLGHRMVDEVLGSQETVRERPVWRSVPPQVRSRLEEPLPRQGIGADAAYEEFRHEDLDLLVEETLRHGTALAAERRDAGAARAAAPSCRLR